MRATFVNHATVLVQHDGVNVLTDPIWSERCSAVQWAGPARHHAPGVSLEALPPIDVVLISHNHYDHLDVDTLSALATRDDPMLVVPLGNGPTVEGLGFSRVVELDWREQVEVAGLQVRGEEVRHFSSRGLFDRNRSLWMGFTVEGAEGGRWYFAGDTGFGKHFAETGAARGPYRLALLPIGAYGPRWFMGPIHMDPDQAVQAHQVLGAQTSVGVHFGTFRLTNEGQDAPVTELAEARRARGLADEAFVALQPGEAVEVP
jgi:L-ascorbate metabolism protein UlaG (beta-lactamase superfamily)